MRKAERGLEPTIGHLPPAEARTALIDRVRRELDHRTPIVYPPEFEDLKRRVIRASADGATPDPRLVADLEAARRAGHVCGCVQWSTGDLVSKFSRAVGAGGPLDPIVDGILRAGRSRDLGWVLTAISAGFLAEHGNCAMESDSARRTRARAARRNADRLLKSAGELAAVGVDTTAIEDEADRHLEEWSKAARSGPKEPPGRPLQVDTMLASYLEDVLVACDVPERWAVLSRLISALFSPVDRNAIRVRVHQLRTRKRPAHRQPSARNKHASV